MPEVKILNNSIASRILLNLFYKNRESYPTEIKKETGIAHPSVINNVKKLIEGGFVCVNKNNKDKKIKEVRLTEKGKLVAEKILELKQELNE